MPVIGGADEYVFETVLGSPALVSYRGERPHLDRDPPTRSTKAFEGVEVAGESIDFEVGAECS